MNRRNNDPTQRAVNRNKALKTSIGTLLLTTGLLIAGDKLTQDPKTSKDAKPNPAVTTPVVETPTTLSEQQRQIKRGLDRVQAEQKIRDEASAYATSKQRTQKIQEAVSTTGTRIVELAESGEVGYFDFYNFNTHNWGRGAGNEGYGFLQHNPQYGGTETQVMVAVYQNGDGSFDLNKIKAVNIHTPGQSAVVFESPDFAATMLDSKHKYLTSWEAAYVSEGPDGILNTLDKQRSGLSDTTTGLTAADFERIDTTALDSLNSQMAQFNS